MEFGGRYTPMDRGYGYSALEESSSSGRSAPKQTATNDLGLSIGDIGFSFSLGPVPNVREVGAKIRGGTKTVEIGFTGMGKGSGQSHTPEYYGEKQRQALREIQAANRMHFTTHSTVGVAGLAGMDQQGNFSKSGKNFAINEIKRAVEFASDVSRGGPVVVHTGEFHRPIADAEWNKQEGYKQKFEQYEGEAERAAYRLVDNRTGSVFQEARKNRTISRPVWNIADKGTEYKDFDGQMKTASSDKDEKGMLIYIDYFGKRILAEERVPKFNEKKGEFDVTQMDWNDLTKEAEQMTLRARETWNDWKKGKISEEEYKKSRWSRFLEAKDVNEVMIKPEEAFIIANFETQAATSRGWAYYYGGSFDQTIENIKKLEKAHEFYKKLESEVDEEKRESLKMQISKIHLPPGLVPEGRELPSKVIEDALREQRRHMKQSQEASASQWAQAEETIETIKHVESADTYAKKEAIDSYAELGLNAMRHSEKLEQQGKMKKPIAIAMENLFPESYGSHPDEMIYLVRNSRERMAEKLVSRGMSREMAEKKAREHLVATIDTGHMNMWRKYWKGDPNKSFEENDKDFDNWMVNKFEQMIKQGIVGHVHLVDNYGYQDDHLAPGEGNTPIRKMIEVLKKNNYKGEMIVEPGADFSTDNSGFHSVMKTWKHLDLPVYSSGLSGGGAGVRGRTWGDVGYGWFDQMAPPYFTFGGYSPTEEWTLWSGVQLE